MFRTRRSLALVVIAAMVCLLIWGCSESARAQVSPAGGSTYYVSPDGSDAAAGTQAAPFRTIHRAASVVEAGDTVIVRTGRYAGFQLGWDSPQGGTATQPVTFKADPGAVIESRNDYTSDGINLEGSSYVIVDGFTVDNASGDIERACIRTVSGRNVTVRSNDVSNCGTWGIFTSHSDYVRIEGNKTSFNNSEPSDNHGIYVSNATVDPVIVGNEIRGNRGAGLHMNGDLSQGGNGLITGARVEGNVIYGNGEKGGSAINCDGVQDSLIRNNLLYGNHASGISLYRIDAAEGARNNVVVNNTIRMASDGRWAVNIKNRSTGNTVSNNVLLHDGPRGAINIVRDSLSGFVSDHNAVTNRFSTDDGESFLTLAQWRDATKGDGNSFASNPAALLVDAAANDYHLSATSPAVDTGASLGAPNVDIEGNGRPVGSAYDIGAYELGGTSPPAPDTTSPEISEVRASNVKRRSVTITWMTDEVSTSTVSYGRTTAYGKVRSSTSPVVRHAITVTGLSANTRYHYRVESEDEAGNPAASADLTFKTARQKASSAPTALAGNHTDRYHEPVRSGTHTFLPTERVHFGAGSLAKVEEEARGRDRAFVVTGRSLYERSDLVRRVEALLGEKHAGTYSGMGQHTPGSAVQEAAGAAREADLLISVGGGSVIDGTKAVARELGYPTQVAVPTTLSGAEWAHRVGVTDESKGRKGGFADPRAVPPVVILDPETTLLTPEKLWLSTGIRALDHAVEGFLFGGEHPVTDVTGLEGARRLVEYLPRSREDPENVGVRLELQIAAWLSYFGPYNTPMGLSHQLGRRIGATYEVPHGVTSCITLAPALDLVRDRVPQDRWRRLEEALGGEPAERVSTLVEALDLPHRLRDVGVPEEDLQSIAGEFGDREDDALTILKNAY